MKISNKSRAIGAFLGLSYGDALGASFEFERCFLNGKEPRFTDKIQTRNQTLLRPWERNSTNQYYPRVEKFKRGQYTDDTQLTLATARSLLYGKEWFKHFTEVELPQFELYKVGSGRATNQAVQSLASGIKPWSKQNKNLRDYENAGGNGTSMRIGPHILVHNYDIRTLLENIWLNGIATHGNAKSIVAGSLLGMIYWGLTLKRIPKSIIKYLIEENAWQEQPEIPDYLIPEGFDSFNEGDYNITVKETLRELDWIKHAIKEKMNDIEAMEGLGAIDKSRGGYSGVKTVLAALYFVEKYKHAPIKAITTPARMVGLDTDTVASIVGGIVGTMYGAELLDPIARDLQDYKYITKLANRLRKGKTIQYDPIKITNKVIENCKEYILFKVGHGADDYKSGSCKIPDQRVIDRMGETQVYKGKGWIHFSRLITLKDGQSMLIQKIKKEK